MKRIVVTSFGIMLAIAMASPNCWALIYQFDAAGGPGDGVTFLNGGNWLETTPPTPTRRTVLRLALATEPLLTTTSSYRMAPPSPPPWGA